MYSTTCFFARDSIPEYELLFTTARGLFELISAPRKEKATYFALITLATLVKYSNATRAQLITEGFVNALPDISSRLEKSANEAIVRAVQELNIVFADQE